ncbi:MAG TPA: Gfo/Idh/MocA family oxidoreductase [Armatimonadetes bacterium]|nr:Gfo/Idh/MocA family oxidoreductase [Armatimonadota bacterium]
MDAPLRLAIVGGGGRGKSFLIPMDALRDKVTPVAVFDPSEIVLEWWKEHRPDVRRFGRYEDLLEHSNADAVLITSPLIHHAPQAVQALNAGKHVLSEVVAGVTIEQCWELVEAVERTKLVYMLAENYCYMRSNMMVLNMVQQGVFGELTYAEGAYIHDCRALMLNSDGTLTWRGALRRMFKGNIYPTHSIGPVAQWFSINRPDGDRFVRTTTFVTKTAALPLYVKERFGAEHPGAKPEFWVNGDSVTTIIETEKGALIVLRVDANSARPHNMTHYVLQGTTAAYISARHGDEENLIWIKGRTPGYSWESLMNYADEYEHPKWRKLGELAKGTGHGGGDLLVLNDFADAVLQGTPPPIDVYDAVTWSSLVPLSIESVNRGNIPVDVPNFKRL